MSEITIVDKKLYDHTEKLLAHVTSAWLKVKDKHEDINKLIEFDINAALMDNLPNKYTGVEISINTYGEMLCVSVDFIKAQGIGLVVKHIIDLPR